jgi:hypothetical protein
MGRAYKEQGIDEPAYHVSYTPPPPKRGRPRKK